MATVAVVVRVTLVIENTCDESIIVTWLSKCGHQGNPCIAVAVATDNVGKSRGNVSIGNRPVVIGIKVSQEFYCFFKNVFLF